MSSEIAGAIAGANTPYKIREIPKQMHLNNTNRLYKPLTYTKNDFLSTEYYLDFKTETEAFISRFNSSPIASIFEIYWAGEDGGALAKRFLCLLCGEFCPATSIIFHASFSSELTNHVVMHHTELLDTTPDDKRENIVNLLYRDFRQFCCPRMHYRFEYISDMEDVEEYLKNNFNCYLCILCGRRYATTPSREVILSHIKICGYVKDCVQRVRICV